MEQNPQLKREIKTTIRIASGKQRRRSRPVLGSNLRFDLVIGRSAATEQQERRHGSKDLRAIDGPREPRDWKDRKSSPSSPTTSSCFVSGPLIGSEPGMSGRREKGTPRSARHDSELRRTSRSRAAHHRSLDGGRREKALSERRDRFLSADGRRRDALHECSPGPAPQSSSVSTIRSTNAPPNQEPSGIARYRANRRRVGASTGHSRTDSMSPR